MESNFMCCDFSLGFYISTDFVSVFFFCSAAVKWISHQFETEAYKCPDFVCVPSLKETAV